MKSRFLILSMIFVLVIGMTFSVSIAYDDFTITFESGTDGAFAGDQNTNEVTYRTELKPTIKYSHTPNIDNDGIATEIYGAFPHGRNDIVSIPEADWLHIELWYATEDTWDFLTIYPDGYTPNEDDWQTMPNFTDVTISGGELSGNYDDDNPYAKPSTRTAEFWVEGNIAQFFFVSDDDTNYYGYYAIITGCDEDKQPIDAYMTEPIEGTYEEPTANEEFYVFDKWVDEDDDPVEVDDITSDTTLYATYRKDIVSGDCGGCIWSIDEGVLTIEPAPGGTGILDYIRFNSYPKFPWENYGAIIKKVVVEDGVKSSAHNLYGMFNLLTQCTEIDISNLDSSAIDCTILYSGVPDASIANMFNECYKLTTIDFGDFAKFVTSGSNDMGCMFQYCESIKELDLSGMYTSNSQVFMSMFEGCTSLESLDISNFDTSKSDFMSNMFTDCDNLKRVVLGPNFRFDGNDIDDEDDWAILPTPPTTTLYTGKWINVDKPELGTFTATQLRDSYTSDYAGTWVWEENDNFTVTFNSHGGTEVEAYTKVISGDKIDKPEDPTKGDIEGALTFGGWFTDTTYTEDKRFDFDEDVITGDLTLHARWDSHTFVCAYDESNNEFGTNEYSTFGYVGYEGSTETHARFDACNPEGTELTLEATPGTGYRFVEWREEKPSGDVVSTTTTLDYEAVGGAKYYAVFEEITFPVRIQAVNAADGSGLAGAKFKLYKGSDVKATITTTTDVELVNLPAGDYNLYISSAPEGYTMPSSYNFTVSSTGVITSEGETKTDGESNTILLAEFSLVHIEISAIDASTEEALPGVKFQIFISGDDIVDEWTSSSGDAHVIEGLKTYTDAFGYPHYIIRATNVPEGYDTPIDASVWIYWDGDLLLDSAEEKNGVIMIPVHKEAKIISSIDITIELPAVGTVVTLSGDNNNTQSPYPVIAIPEDVNYYLDEGEDYIYGNWYIDPECYELFSGEMISGETYYALVWIGANEEYFFSGDVTVNMTPSDLEYTTFSYSETGLYKYVCVTIPVTIGNNYYTITFVDEDDSFISSGDYLYGTPSGDIVKPKTPKKASDKDYTYKFDKWTPDIVKVTEDATYKASYTKTKKSSGGGTSGSYNKPTQKPSGDEVTKPSGDVIVKPSGDVVTGDLTNVKLIDNGNTHTKFIVGYPDETFKPDGFITREEAATIFYRITKKDVNVDTSDCKFQDVEKDRWSYEYIAYLQKRGVITGYPDGKFKPEQNITRAEFAQIVCKYATYKDTLVDNKFKDIIDHWAFKAILTCAYNNWVIGYEDGTFKPDNYITRAEVTTIIDRVLNYNDYDKTITRYSNPFSDLTTEHWGYKYIIEAYYTHEIM